MMKIQSLLDFLYFQMDEALICINVILFFSYYNYNLLKFSYKSMLKFENQFVYNILFIHFSYIKIPRTLCVTNYKLNGVHHCFIMKIKEVLNRFFHVYAINVIMITWSIIFWHILPCVHLGSRIWSGSEPFKLYSKTMPWIGGWHENRKCWTWWQLWLGNYLSCS
jgi:hypothetical protein